MLLAMHDDSLNLGLFLTDMSAPGTANELGIVAVPQGKDYGFEVPCLQPADPNVNGGQPIPGGSRTDMGSLVLCLVSNWVINGATVLIDGGVSWFLSISWVCAYNSVCSVDYAGTRQLVLNTHQRM